MSPFVQNSLLDGLTPAERLVAVHIAEGLSNKEIAAVLGKAEATVKHQVSRILRATSAASRCRFIASYHQQYQCAARITAVPVTGLN